MSTLYLVSYILQLLIPHIDRCKPSDVRDLFKRPARMMTDAHLPVRPYAQYTVVWSSAGAVSKDRESQTTRSPSSSAGAGTAIGRESRYFLLTVQLADNTQLSVSMFVCFLFLN